MLRSATSAVALVTFLVASLPADAQTFLNKSSADWAKDLGNNDATVRRSAAFALGKCKASSSAKQLMDVLKKDKDEGVRETAAFALGEVGDSSAVPALVTALKDDPSPVVKRSAAAALGMLKADTPAALNALKSALGNQEDARVRQNAAWAIGQLDKKNLTDAVAADLGALLRDKNDALLRRDAAMALSNAGENARNAVQDLAGAVNDENVAVRQYAAMALSGLGKNSDALVPFVPSLGKAIANPKQDPAVQEYVVLALVNVGPAAKDAVPELRRVIADSKVEPKVRRNAAAAIARIGPDGADALAELVQVLKDDNLKKSQKQNEREIRWQAANAVAELHEKAEPKLNDIVDILDTDADVLVRHYLSRMLQYIPLSDPKYQRAREVLIKVALKDAEKGVRYQAAIGVARALRQDGAAVVPTLIAFLKDASTQQSQGTSGTATTGAVESGTGSTGVKEVAGGDGRVLAANALGLIGASAGPDAKKALEEASKDPKSKELRDAANEALKRFD